MIDASITFSYKTPGEYAKSVQEVRDLVGEWVKLYYVLKDRKTDKMRRIAVSVVDEKGNSSIELCLLGNTVYILGMRLPGQKWFVTKDQTKEFGSCRGSIIADLPFKCGYGELGVKIDTEVFNIREASRYCAAMKAYIEAYAERGTTSDQVTKECGMAFAYFAMTIAEAARFCIVENNFLIEPQDPGPLVQLLQEWVLRSSVADEKFPTHFIKIAGIHESQKSDVWAKVVARLSEKPEYAPTHAVLHGDSEGTKAFLAGTGPFTALKGSKKGGWQVGYEFLLAAFFLSRCTPKKMTDMRKRFDDMLKRNKPVASNSMEGLGAVLK